jgi:hypothetical protein
VFVRVGCCVALVLVPLLLLTTPSRGASHAPASRAGTPGHAWRAAGHASMWALAAALTGAMRGAGSPDPSTATPGPDAGSAVPDVTASSSVPRAVNTVSLAIHRQMATTTTSPQAALVAHADAPAPSATPTTTTTAPPPKPPAPTTTTTTAPAHTESGVASWYTAPAGTCASPSLAFGTVLTVTDVATGKSVTCTVDDRQADSPGRVVDLAEATFAQLAAPAAGVIDVRLTW